MCCCETNLAVWIIYTFAFPVWLSWYHCLKLGGISTKITRSHRRIPLNFWHKRPRPASLSTNKHTAGFLVLSWCFVWKLIKLRNFQNCPSLDTCTEIHSIQVKLCFSSVISPFPHQVEEKQKFLRKFLKTWSVSVFHVWKRTALHL